jgi:uncharacterized MAPEG superfamily protein
MTLPVWMLLGFAIWTVMLLMATIGVYRWGMILTRGASISGFPADKVEGPAWYARAMRAHANCIENLPVFAVVIFALHVSGTSGALVDTLAVAVLAARVLQSSIHVAFEQTNSIVSIRFTLFSVQVASYLWLAAIVVAGQLHGS